MTPSAFRKKKKRADRQPLAAPQYLSFLRPRSYNHRNRHNDQYPQRKEVLLRSIQAYIQQHSRSPTLRELQALTGWCLPTLRSYLERLEAEGLILVVPFSKRGIRLK